MVKLRILHLSDLHAGLDGQRYLFPNYREDLFNDLDKLADDGAVDLIVFTGDLTQRGGGERTEAGMWPEFELFQEEMKRIQDHLDRRTRKRPIVFAVPGNHDLVRPKRDPRVAVLTNLWETSEPDRHEFWTQDNSPYRAVVEEAFKPYKTWWEHHCSEQLGGVSMQHGLLPGDFSATLQIGGVMLGLVGLNSAFLQLTADPFEGKLDLDMRQLARAVGKDVGDWFQSHHLTLLLTHHPPSWLSVRGRRTLDGDIARAGRFTLHLFGHMHQGAADFKRKNGLETVRQWQGHSLFGLERCGNGREERSLGYSLLEFEVEPPRAALRIYPRRATRVDTTLTFNPDTGFKLDGSNRFSEEIKVPTLGVLAATEPAAPEATGRLRPPGGPYARDAYLPRPAIEGRALDLLLWPGRPAVLYGPRYHGRTWLIGRLLDLWREHEAGARALRLNLRSFGDEALSNMDRFVFQLAAAVGEEMGIADEAVDALDPARPQRRSPMDRLRRFLVQNVLKDEQPMLLALDDADVIRERAYRVDFYGGLRAWMEEDAAAPINRLRLLLSVSTPTTQLIEGHEYRSLWNLTVPITVPPFDVQEVIDLGRGFGLTLNRAVADTVIDATGAVPGRVAESLHKMAQLSRPR